MSLKYYYEKIVNILTMNEKTFEGKVTDYFYPEDNETGKESIAIRDKLSGNLVEFQEDDIKSIEVIS